MVGREDVLELVSRSRAGVLRWADRAREAAPEQVDRAAVLKGLGVSLAVLLVTTAYVGYGYQQNPPEVRSVDSEWDGVTDEETTVETTVVVANDNAVPVPEVASVRYAMAMNDVVMMEGSKSGIGVDSGRTEITIPATLENEAVAEWWVTHVNNGERSTMAVNATVVAPGGVERQLVSRTSAFETDMLGNLQRSGSKTITLQGEPFIVLQEQTASWGEADMAETPIDFSATVANRHDRDVTLDGLGYVIEMNDVVVGEGRTTDGVAIAPGETGTVDVRAVIDTPKMADWWATHVRNDESTRMSVEMYGLVERDGELRRVPFDLVEETLRFRTDMLDGGGTDVEPVANDAGGVAFERPTVADQSREWGRVTDETTVVRSTATLENPNDGRINDFVRLRAGQRVTVNGVVVANETERVGSLQPGTTAVETGVGMNNSKVPRWWARHVNRGEQSTLVIEPRTTADLGFTAFDVGLERRASTFETDLLSGLDTDETQVLQTEGGTEVARVTSIRTRWGEADAEFSPIVVEATIRNTFQADITLRDLQYAIGMNDVVVGNGTAPESHTLAPGETETVTFTIGIDSQRMDEWWVSHVENGERTRVDFDASVAVEVAIRSERVQLDSLTRSQNVTTDFLGNGTAARSERAPGVATGAGWAVVGTDRTEERYT